MLPAKAAAPDFAPSDSDAAGLVLGAGTTGLAVRSSLFGDAGFGAVRGGLASRGASSWRGCGCEEGLGSSRRGRECAFGLGASSDRSLA